MQNSHAALSRPDLRVTHPTRRSSIAATREAALSLCALCAANDCAQFKERGKALRVRKEVFKSTEAALSIDVRIYTVMMLLFAVVGFLVLANIALSLIARWLNPPIGKFVEVDGVRLHYIDRGSQNGLPIVMLHGNGTLLQDLTICGLVDSAAKRFRVICFDRPGFGFSSRPRFQIWDANRQAELFCAALTQLGVNQCLVLGHSWGTLVALAMAARRSDQVKGLVLVSGYYFPTKRFDVWFASIAAIPLVGDLLRYTISPISTWLSLPVLAKKVFSPKPIPTVVKNQYPKLLLIRPGQLRAVAEEAAFMVPSAASLSSSYRELNCPTAIFAGRSDQIVDNDQAVRLQRTLPRATLARLDGVGHMAHYFVVDEIIKSADTVRAEAVLTVPERRDDGNVIYPPRRVAS